MNKELNKKKDILWLWLVIPNILLLIYVIIMGCLGDKYDWNLNLAGTNVSLGVVLLIMFILELLSTITFQTRIWLTSKDKIKLAAFIGALSWMIAGFQGLLVISENITHLDNVASFFIKMPPVLVATFVGILSTSYVNKIMKQKESTKNENS